MAYTKSVQFLLWHRKPACKKVLRKPWPATAQDEWCSSWPKTLQQTLPLPQFLCPQSAPCGAGSAVRQSGISWAMQHKLCGGRRPRVSPRQHVRGPIPPDHCSLSPGPLGEGLPQKGWCPPVIHMFAGSTRVNNGPSSSSSHTKGTQFKSFPAGSWDP